MNSRASLAPLAFGLVAALGGCGENVCQQVVDAIDRAEKVQGCSDYMMQFVATEPSFNADDCAATDLDAKIHGLQARCFDDVKDCGVASQVTLVSCLEKASAGKR